MVLIQLDLQKQQMVFCLCELVVTFQASFFKIVTNIF